MTTHNRPDLDIPDPMRWIGARFGTRLLVPSADHKTVQTVLWTIERHPVIVASDTVPMDATSEETARCLVDALRMYAGKAADPVGGLVAIDQELADMVRPHVSDKYHVEVEDRPEPDTAWTNLRAGIGHASYSAQVLFGWRGPSVTRWLRSASKLYRRAPWCMEPEAVAHLEIADYGVECTLNPTRSVIEEEPGLMFVLLPSDEQQAPGPGVASFDLMVVSFMCAPPPPPFVVEHLRGLGFDVPDVVPLLGVHRGIDILCPLTDRDFDVAYAFCEVLDRMLGMPRGNVAVEFVAHELPGRPTVRGNMLW